MIPASESIYTILTVVSKIRNWLASSLDIWPNGIIFHQPRFP